MHSDCSASEGSSRPAAMSSEHRALARRYRFNERVVHACTEGFEPAFTRPTLWGRWDCCGASRGNPASSRSRLRKLVAASALIAALAARASGQEPAEDGLVPPEVAIQEGELAPARAAFRTKLLRQGPAPARAKMPETPPGVTRVEFPSGDLRLAAWLQRPAGDDGGGSRSPGVVFLHGGFGFGLADWRMAAPFLDAGYVL